MHTATLPSLHFEGSWNSFAQIAKGDERRSEANEERIERDEINRQEK
jgi:hypothetical protein